MLFCVYNINRYSEAFWNCYTPTDKCHEDIVTVKPFLLRIVIYIFMRAQKVTNREPLHERTCLALCVNILDDVQIESLDLQSLLQVPNEMNDMWEHRKNIPGTLLQDNEIWNQQTANDVFLVNLMLFNIVLPEIMHVPGIPQKMLFHLKVTYKVVSRVLFH